ncbi:MAG: GDP-mannose 4,6-dehydratase [Dissulfurimicrobium sp.]|uniref:GDP-mannose 4,6-dehydratase n=1 Tax=Dissulfurimicrobium sp. TaxID=2022436 RepID=UPI004049F236
MKVLLTGANGFVGHHVMERLDCVPLFLNGARVDIRDACAVLTAVKTILKDVSFDAVIHLAAQSFVPESFKDPRATFDVNFFGTLNLLSALKEEGFKGKMIFVGSGDVYGLVPSDRLPIVEDTPPKPRNPYAVSKLAAEALCYQWSQTEGFEIVMTRPFNHIGPGQDECFVVSSLAKQVMEIKMGIKRPVIEVGDIDVTRDFIDVRDVVRAYKLLLEYGTNGEIYNICSGKERIIRNILERLMELAGIEADIHQNPSRMRVAEQRRVCGSPERLIKDTGWAPQISFDDALKDILDYWGERVS